MFILPSNPVRWKLARKLWIFKFVYLPSLLTGVNQRRFNKSNFRLIFFQVLEGLYFDFFRFLFFLIFFYPSCLCLSVSVSVLFEKSIQWIVNAGLLPLNHFNGANFAQIAITMSHLVCGFRFGLNKSAFNWPIKLPRISYDNVSLQQWRFHEIFLYPFLSLSLSLSLSLCHSFPTVSFFFRVVRLSLFVLNFGQKRSYKFKSNLSGVFPDCRAFAASCSDFPNRSLFLLP